jgi:hypothetical protein
MASLVFVEAEFSYWLEGSQPERFASLIGLSGIGAMVYLGVSYLLNTLGIRSKVSR